MGVKSRLSTPGFRFHRVDKFAFIGGFLDGFVLVGGFVEGFALVGGFVDGFSLVGGFVDEFALVGGSMKLWFFANIFKSVEDMGMNPRAKLESKMR